MDDKQMMVRGIVRTSYDIQTLRIQLGNRVVAAFKNKLGIKPSNVTTDNNDPDDKKAKELMGTIKASYKRISDSLIDHTSKKNTAVMKHMEYDDIISNYAEYVLANQYLSLLNEEEKHFDTLEAILEEIPIYREFLSKIQGMGPQIAGVIISEIDIHKAEYPSSLWAYCGLDCVIVGKYTDDKGTVHVVHPGEIAAHYEKSEDPNAPMYIDGYPVTISGAARSKRAESLVKREYIAKDGTTKVKNSITFNPFLRAKLIGVLGPVFLKQSRTYVDGLAMGVERRRAFAKQLGMTAKVSDTAEVDKFLAGLGMEVVFTPVGYAKTYYDYKNRLQNDPRHSTKTAIHIHNMSIRYCIKRLLVDLYKVWRELEGLPVAPEYSEAKLGMIHKVATEDKGLKRA